MKTYQRNLVLLLTLTAFAANSLLCRAALRQSAIDPISFSALRIASGAVLLQALLRVLPQARKPQQNTGSWLSALALLIYAIGFSLAYVAMSTGTGALLLFGAVQLTMITAGLVRGEKLSPLQIVGLICAVGGLVGLAAPGLQAPPLGYSALMLAAGAAWGMYSLRGRGTGSPVLTTAGNFLRATPAALFFYLLWPGERSANTTGILLALTSGALASALSYVLWYSVLPTLSATAAASIQLTVPVLAAVMGIVFLSEQLTLALALATLPILGGVALVIFAREKLKA